MQPTYYEKTSPGGILGARFVNLQKEIGQYRDVSEIASKLRMATWE